MERVQNIESLSLMFTAGVAAGTLLLPGTGMLLPAVLLPILALPILLRDRLARCREELSIGLILATFLLLGIFCARTAAIPCADLPNALELWADAAVTRLRAHIYALPFPSEGTAALVSALLTGEKGVLPADTAALFRGSGASHLLALSGLHMGILYVLFNALTKPLGGYRPARIVRAVLLVAGAGFFTLMAGAGPSLVRAFLFISINEILRLFHRPRRGSQVFCVALLIQLVWDPTVISSLGFQLSYLAMAGIFLLYPVLERWYPADGKRFDPMRKLWSLAALSISCQVFTAPLAWLRFHTFPRFFLVTNLLALPLTSAFMTGALASLALDGIGLTCQPLITATDGLGRLLLWVLEVISSM